MAAIYGLTGFRQLKLEPVYYWRTAPDWVTIPMDFSDQFDHPVNHTDIPHYDNNPKARNTKELNK